MNFFKEQADRLAVFRDAQLMFRFLLL